MLDTLCRIPATFVVVLDVFCLQVKFMVDVPANSHDGDQIRVPGMGNAGTNGSATGDFYRKY